MRAACPRTGGQPGVGRHAGKLGVVSEDVELPRGGRVGAEHVTLKTDAVHEVSNRGLGAGEVGVGFVVGAAHHLDAAVGDEPAQVGAVLGMGVPERLEVVDLGQHELVLRFAPRHLEMRAHQVETVGLTAPAWRLLGPHAGVGRLGVPPDRVVVEVADHVQCPAGLGDGEHERRDRVPGDDARVALLADDRIGHRHRHLDAAVAGLRRGTPPQTVAFDAHGPGTAGVADPHQLQRRVRRPCEQLRRLRGDDVHAKTLRRQAREMSTTSAR